MAWNQIIGPLADADHNHNAAYDAIGASAAAVGAHEGAVNPHPTYLTEAEADALYSDILHNHDADYADIAHQHLVVANSQIGTTYTLTLGDVEETIEFDNALAITLTVPTNITAAFPVGTSIELVQVGAGQVTVVGAGGVTVNARVGLKLAGQWAVAKLVKRATNTWILSGDVAA